MPQQQIKGTLEFEPAGGPPKPIPLWEIVLSLIVITFALSQFGVLHSMLNALAHFAHLIVHALQFN